MKLSRTRLLALAGAATVALVVAENWPARERVTRVEARERVSFIVPPVQAGPAAAEVPDDALDMRRVVARVAGMPPPLDAFDARSWVRPPPPPPPAPPPPPQPPPPPPQAPALPFKYLGHLEESAQRTLWYLARGEEVLVVADGEAIDGTYRVDGARSGALLLTYLPLNIAQSLPIGAVP